MGFWSKLIGAQATAPIKAIGNVVDSLFTSDEERLDKKIIMQRLAMQPDLAQSEINKVQAQHRSVFVAGARPFIQWVGGFGMLWHFMLADMVRWYMAINHPDIAVPELLGTQELISIVMATLGLGAFRTVEKLQGRAK